MWELVDNNKKSPIVVHFFQNAFIFFVFCLPNTCTLLFLKLQYVVNLRATTSNTNNRNPVRPGETVRQPKHHVHASETPTTQLEPEMTNTTELQKRIHIHAHKHTLSLYKHSYLC